jgi:hypothetical protein
MPAAASRRLGPSRPFAQHATTNVPQVLADACSLEHDSCICDESAPALLDCGDAKMASKQVTLAVGAVLFTAVNLLVLAANWSMTAHAKVADRDYSALEVNADFRRAIRDVVSQIDQSYWRRNNAFRGAVMDVVEKSCHVPYRGSTNLWCRVQSF